MKQSDSTNLLASATEDELLVAEILLDLPNIISQSESQTPHFSELTWSRKRRRSSLQLGAPNYRAPAPDSPLVLKVEDEIEESWSQVKHRDNGCGATTTGTPDTPLFFPCSESDEKPKHSSKKRSNKRSKKQFIKVEELTQTRDVLRREIENVRKHYNKLKDLNSKLKDMKEKVLKTSSIKEQSQKEICQSGMILGMQSTRRPHQITMAPHQQPLIENLTAQTYPRSLGPIAAQTYSANNGLGWVNSVGPVELPDLNVSSFEEAVAVGQSQPLDVERAFADRRSREHRRMRKDIMKKNKASRRANGIKLPRR